MYILLNVTIKRKYVEILGISKKIKNKIKPAKVGFSIKKNQWVLLGWLHPGEPCYRLGAALNIIRRYPNCIITYCTLLVGAVCTRRNVIHVGAGALYQLLDHSHS